MYAGDEIHGDDVTSGPAADEVADQRRTAWLRGLADRMDVALGGPGAEESAGDRLRRLLAEREALGEEIVEVDGDLLVAHAYECWEPRGGICQLQCSCSCHVTESEARLLDGNR